MNARLFLPVSFLMLLMLQLLRAEEGGEVGRNSYYTGKIDSEGTRNQQCVFTVEIDPTLFRLTSFKGKYKVIRIRVENGRSESLKLSAEKDSVDVELADGSHVKGVLNLQAHDGPVWDALDDSTRSTLAYPMSIRGAKGEDTHWRRPEVGYVFLFLPDDGATRLPRSFTFSIESVGKPIRIEHPPVALE